MLHRAKKYRLLGASASIPNCWKVLRVACDVCGVIDAMLVSRSSSISVTRGAVRTVDGNSSFSVVKQNVDAETEWNYLCGVR